MTEIPSFAPRHPPAPGRRFSFAAFAAFCAIPVRRRLSDIAVHIATFSPVSVGLSAFAVGDDRTKPYGRGGGTKINPCLSTTCSNHFRTIVRFSWNALVTRHSALVTCLSIRACLPSKPKTDNKPTGNRTRTDTQPIPMAPIIGYYRLLSPIIAKPRIFPEPRSSSRIVSCFRPFSSRRSAALGPRPSSQIKVGPCRCSNHFKPIQAFSNQIK
jgi:hypothetical protein